MTYEEAIDFLYNSLPAFEKGGAKDYKPGLATTLALSEMFGNPHRGLRCVHVAGTNGKGSTASTIAAILQSTGMKTGLYTSPHIFSFTERIRINGEPIAEAEVTDFVERYQQMASDKKWDYAPTFFELTTIMAFEYFARHNVEVAIIETGLGGRLDSTNIIRPVVSIITNIALDHTDLLGDTLEAIAAEKAGIMKPGVPVVIGEAKKGSGVRQVFEARAKEIGAPIYFAEDENVITAASRCNDGQWKIVSPTYYNIRYSLAGDCQIKNAATVLTAIEKVFPRCPMKSVLLGFSNVAELTGLTGRWTVVSHAPMTIIDTAHNAAGWVYNVAQLERFTTGKRHLVIGFVADKDVDAILKMLPTDASFYFATPGGHRAMSADELQKRAKVYGIEGKVIADVNEAVAEARKKAAANDMIFIGGSNYLIAQLSISERQ